MPTALHVVQKLFPNVTKVVDATKDSIIEVTNKDTKSATVRNHTACAMAVACKRKFDLDGVIMSVSKAYLVKDNKAIRFSVPPSVSREIVAFDRNAPFEPGEYKLKAITETARLGQASGRKNKKSGKNNPNKRFIHKTEGIRTSLGNKHTV